MKEDARKVTCGVGLVDCALPPPQVVLAEAVAALASQEVIKEIIKLVVAGTTLSYSLELKLGDCKRAVAIQ